MDNKIIELIKLKMSLLADIYQFFINLRDIKTYERKYSLSKAM